MPHSRRGILKRIMTGMLFPSIPVLSSLPGCSSLWKQNSRKAPLTRSQRHLLQEVLFCLFPPSTRAPGAQNTNLISFFELELTKGQLQNHQKSLIQGLKKIDRLLSNRDFKDLTLKDKNKILEKIQETDSGHSWLKLVLSIGIEGMFADPIYLSNKDQKNWNWLKVIPGFPRPQRGQRYFEL